MSRRQFGLLNIGAMLLGVVLYLLVAGSGELGTSSIAHADTPHTHCICGETISEEAAELGGHTHETHEWEPWSTVNKLPTTSGYYYLTANVNLTATQILKPDATVYLCLNGFNVTTTGIRIYTTYSGTKNAQGENIFYDGVTLSICDCTKNPGTMKNAGTTPTNNDGGVFFIALSQDGHPNVLNIYGGIFTNSSGATAKCGAVVSLSTGHNVMNLYGGIIKDGYAAPYTSSSGTVTNYSGGNIHVYGHSTVNMYGGTISGGHASSNGGNVYVESNATFNLYNGLVTGGTAENSGGNFLNYGTVNLYGGAVTNGRTVNGNGGNFYLQSGTLNMFDGEISGGVSKTNDPTPVYKTSSSIYVGAATMNISGGTISEVKQSSGYPVSTQKSNSVINVTGGNIDTYIQVVTLGGRMNISGGIFTQPVYPYNGTVTITDGVFKNTVSMTQGSQAGGGLIIHGGVFEGSVSNDNINGCDVVIDGGYFKKAPSKTARSTGALTISGGTFVTLPSSSTYQGYTATPISEEYRGNTYNYKIGDASTALTVTATSRLVNAEMQAVGAQGIVPVSGAGETPFGGSKTVEAEMKKGYRFIGWYYDLGEEDYSKESAISSALSYTKQGIYNHSALVALFMRESAEKPSLTVSSGDVPFTVSVNGAPAQNGSDVKFYAGLFDFGTEVTLTFREKNATLRGWANENGKILSQNESLTWTLGTATVITAVTEETGAATVAQVSDFNQVLDIRSVSGALLERDIVETPVRLGRTFRGYKIKGNDTLFATKAEVAGKATELISQGVSYIEIMPVFERDASKAVLTVKAVTTDRALSSLTAEEISELGKTASVLTTVEAELAAKTELTLSATFGGKQFSGAALVKSGLTEILSSERTFTFGAFEDETIYAIYGAETDTVPVIAFTGAEATLQPADTRYTYSFAVARSVPEGWSVTEQGILYTNGAKFADSSEADNAMTLESGALNEKTVFAARSSEVDRMGVTVLNIKNVPGNIVFYAKGYMVLSHTENGEAVREVIYSRMMTGSQKAGFGFYREDGETYCACGGTLEENQLLANGEKHTHVYRAYTPWTMKNALPTLSGYYILNTDVSLTESQEITEAGADIVLILNGHSVSTTALHIYELDAEGISLTISEFADKNGKMTGRSSAAVSADDLTILTEGGQILIANRENCTFTLMNGTLIAGRAHIAAADGGLVSMTKNGSTFNMFGGSIQKGRVTNEDTVKHVGGNVALDGEHSVFNMIGGTIQSGQAQSRALTPLHVDGGNVSVGSATANIYGGLISHGVASNGGNIAVGENGTLNLLGGTLLVGIAAENGGNVYAEAGASVQLSKVTLDTGMAQGHGGNLYNEGTITVSGRPTVTNGFGRDNESPSNIITTTELLSNGTVSASVLSALPVNDEPVVTPSAGAGVTGTHKHTVACKENMTSGSGAVTMTAWTDPTKLPSSGNYYLATDVVLSSEASISKSLTLCLNGHTITGAWNKRVIPVSGGTFNLMDCSEEESGAIIARGITWRGACLYVSGCTVNLYGGTMYGGIVNGDTSKGTAGNGGGGCIYETSSATVNMYGGRLVGGKSIEGVENSHGGNVCNMSKFNLYGGVIENGYSALRGGNVSFLEYAADKQSVLTGGVIRNGFVVGTGRSAAGGGNLSMNPGTSYADKQMVTIGGNVRIENGTARNGNGGNILVNLGNVTLTGSPVITGGTAVNGGGIYVNGVTNEVLISGSPVITGNRIENGEASNILVNPLTRDLGQKVRFSALTSGATLGIDSKLDGVESYYSFAVGDADFRSFFTTDSETQIIAYENGIYSFTKDIPDEGFMVGFDRQSIDPLDANGKLMDGIPLAGYGNTAKRLATTIDPNGHLTATAVAFRAENRTLVMITADIIRSNETLVNTIRSQVARELGIPVTNILFTATHTHSGPDISSSLNSIKLYTNRVFVPRIVLACKNAVADLTRVTETKAGETHTNNLNFVRHYILGDTDMVSGDNFNNYTTEDGLYGTGLGKTAHTSDVDTTAALLSFKRENNDTIVMMNWRAHPTLTGSYSLTTISADYVAYLRANFEAETGAKLAFFQGAAGNNNAVSGIAQENITQYSLGGDQAVKLAFAARVGKALSDTMVALYRGDEATFKTVDMNGAEIELVEDQYVGKCKNQDTYTPAEIQNALAIKDHWTNDYDGKDTTLLGLMLKATYSEWENQIYNSNEAYVSTYGHIYWNTDEDGTPHWYEATLNGDGTCSEKEGAVFYRSEPYPMRQYETHPGTLGEPSGVMHSPYHANSLTSKYTKTQETQAITLYAFRIGTLAFTEAPYEMYHEDGTLIREKMRSLGFDSNFVIAYSNSSNSYMPSEQGFRQGAYRMFGSYEADQCYYEGVQYYVPVSAGTTWAPGDTTAKYRPVKEVVNGETVTVYRDQNGNQYTGTDPLKAIYIGEAIADQFAKMLDRLQ